ncbi:MAG: hypothetical protein ACE14T_02935 [Syntrophales bacterium]
MKEEVKNRPAGGCCFGWFIVIFLLVFSIPKAHAYEKIFEWDEFRVKPPFYSTGIQNWDELKRELSDSSQEYVNSPDFCAASPQPGETKPKGFNVHHFRFTFTRHTLSQENHSQVVQPEMNQNKLEMLKTLPSTLQNSSSARERFEAVGKIFEPKVNLSIEF